MIPQAQQSSDVLVLQVTVNLDEAQGSGVAWLEAECNGFMSPALPIVLCEDPDIVEELRSLEAEVLMAGVLQCLSTRSLAWVNSGYKAFLPRGEPAR